MAQVAQNFLDRFPQEGALIDEFNKKKLETIRISPCIPKAKTSKEEAMGNVDERFAHDWVSCQ